MKFKLLIALMLFGIGANAQVGVAAADTSLRATVAGVQQVWKSKAYYQSLFNTFYNKTQSDARYAPIFGTGYIQNQSASAQSATAWIDGNFQALQGRFGSGSSYTNVTQFGITSPTAQGSSLSWGSGKIDYLATAHNFFNPDLSINYLHLGDGTNSPFSFAPNLQVQKTPSLANDVARKADIDLKANVSGQLFTGAISATNLSGTNTGDQDISGKENSSNKVTTLTGANNTTYPTSLAVQTAIAANVPNYPVTSVNGRTGAVTGLAEASALTTETSRATAAETTLQQNINKAVSYTIDINGVAGQNFVVDSRLIAMLPTQVFKGTFYSINTTTSDPLKNVTFDPATGRITFPENMVSGEVIKVTYAGSGNTAYVPGSVATSADLMGYTKRYEVNQEKITINSLTSNTGFVATANGITPNVVNASAEIDVSFIDTSKPFRIDMVVKITDATVTADNFQVSFGQKGSSDARVNNSFVFDNTNKAITAYSGASYYLGNTSTPFVSGDSYQFSIISTGTKVSAIIKSISKPWNAQFSAGVFLPNNDGRIGYRVNPITFLSGGFSPFTNLNDIKITAASVGKYEVQSVYASNTMSPPKWGLVTIYEPNILNDGLDGTYPSMVISPKGSEVLVQYHHPNATAGAIPGTTGLNRLVSALFNNGKSICYGTFNSYNNPAGTNLFGAGVTSSNWGAPTGLKYRKSLQDNAVSVLNPKSIFQLGASMGGLNSVMFATNYPDKLKGVIGISPAFDTETNFAGGTYGNIIKKAFGTAYRSLVSQTGVTPVDDGINWVKIGGGTIAPVNSEYLNPFYDTYSASKSYVAGNVVFVNFSGAITDIYEYVPYRNLGLMSTVPLLSIHGDADTDIPIAQSINYLTNLRAKGNYSTTLITKVGAGHIADACYDEVAILAFIENHQ